MKLSPPHRWLGVLLLGSCAFVASARAWDYEGHRVVNQLAIAGLPAEFPAFVRAPEARERLAFLSGEPDRWRNVDDLPVRHAMAPDHYIDIEELALAGLDVHALSPLRYVFAIEFAAQRAAHADRFPAINPARNSDHTREWCGFLPWAITEQYGKLRAAFAYLRAFEQFGGTPDEIANAQANAIYVMGVMGHFVGDAAQPLHTTVQFNGWTGDNPRGFTTWNGFHQWIDGGFFSRTGLKFEPLAPRARAARPIALTAAPDARDPVFVAVVDYILRQNQQVEPLYALELAGKLKADGSPGSTDGRALLEEQLLRGGQMLASLWLTAWRDAPEDEYLRTRLQARSAAPAPAPNP